MLVWADSWSAPGDECGILGCAIQQVEQVAADKA